MTTRFAFAMAWREARGSRRLALTVGAVSLGVAALVATNSFSSNVTASVRAQARTLLPADVEIHYAMKANPMPAVVRHFVGLVDGLDVASGHELEVALAAGGHPANISFVGPGKSEAELAQSVAAGITINVESEREIRTLAAPNAGRGS